VFDVNVAGVFEAAEYARNAGAKTFVFASSGSVYGSGSIPLSENQPFAVPGSRAFYPAAKLAAELLLAPFAQHFNVVTLRLFVPYGAGQSADMLFPQLVRRVREGEAITLAGGDGFRANPVAVSDVTETIDRCLRIERSVTMNLAGPQVATLREIGRGIGDTLGIAPIFDLRSGAAAEDVIGDTTTLQHMLQWAPSRTIAQGLGEWLSSPDA
jgi:nucleoside-diphosphate-sugar epimerase